MKKTLWLTYAWKDNEKGDFDYLVNEIKSIGIDCKFDRIALIPGKPLWEQIGEQILNPKVDAWAYLITRDSINSTPCREELSYALDKAISSGNNFPILGLIHDVSYSDVPVPIRTRLCIELKSQNWKEQLLAGLEGRAPKLEEKQLDRLKIVTHINSNQTLIELTPRFEELRNWRIAIPNNIKILSWGVGAANSKNINPIKFGMIEGTIDFGTVKHNFVGTSDAINAANSIYIQVEGGPPDFYYGFADGSNGIPDLWYPKKTSKQ